MGGGANDNRKTQQQLAGSIGNAALDTFEQGPPVYNQSLYTPFSGATQGGLAGILSGVNNYGSGQFQAANDYAGGLIDRGGMTQGQQAATGTINDATQGYGSLYNALGGPTMAEDALGATARGDNLGGSNPYFRSALDQAVNDTASDVNAYLGSMGRIGSNVQDQTLTREIGNLRTNAMNQNYETERDRQMQALSAIQGAEGQQFGQQAQSLAGMLGGAGQAIGAEQQGVSNALGAAGMLPQLYQNQFTPQNTQIGAGQILDEKAKEKTLADFDLFNRTQNADMPWQQQYANLYRTLNPNDEQPANPFTTALGIGGGLASLFL